MIVDICGIVIQKLSVSLLMQISVVTRDEVGAYKPYLWEQSCFTKGPMFREWMLTKVITNFKDLAKKKSVQIMTEQLNQIFLKQIKKYEDKQCEKDRKNLRDSKVKKGRKKQGVKREKVIGKAK